VETTHGKMKPILPWVFGGHLLFAGLGASGQPAPLWEKEASLRDLSRSATVTGVLQANDPQPGFEAWPSGRAFLISNLAMRTTLWGTPDSITVSLMKNDVFDRRVPPVHAPTLAEITEGSFAPVNAGLTNQSSTGSRRPSSLGYLSTEGGFRDPFRQPIQYSFPCPKPVGQIILGLEGFDGAEVSPIVQRCEDAVTVFTESKGGREARIEAVLGMTNNVYAFRVRLSGSDLPLTLRLFRHRDTSHQAYMDEDGLRYTRTEPEITSGRSWNGPLDAPRAGVDHGDPWIRQDFPAEETFPKGNFGYVVVGRVVKGSTKFLECDMGKRRLGTPPPDPLIANAKGAAATATVAADGEGVVELLVATVSSLDDNDSVGLLAEARRRLDRAQAAGGFRAVEHENKEWFGRFYDLREEGRVFSDDPSHPWPGESLPDLFRSWSCTHGGNTKPDMERLQASAHYANPETDNQRWHGLPCYNEIFYTHRYVHHWGDSVDLWRKLVRHWRTGGEENARDTYGLPGMYLPHGYQPPTSGKRYFHTSAALELCLGTAAQLLHPLWDEWDYGGNPSVLREIYPPLKKTAEFYSAYLKKGVDGLFHAIPSVAEENWGIWPRFSRNRDVTSAVAMIRWELNRAAEAADTLGVDAREAAEWRFKASRLPEPWTCASPEGPILTDVCGVMPVRGKLGHPWDADLYPVTLADKITLGSPVKEREMALRTATNLPNASTLEARILLGDTRFKSGQEGDSHGPGSTAEALLNSRDGVIRFFPGVAGDSRVAFRHFQARGGFLVSASRRGVCTFAEITARRGCPCAFVSPWDDREPMITSSGRRIQVRRDDVRHCWVFDAERGKTYRLSGRKAEKSS
jgi:hypothetical protein